MDGRARRVMAIIGDFARHLGVGPLTDAQSRRILAAVTDRLDGFVKHGFQHDFHPPHSGPG